MPDHESALRPELVEAELAALRATVQLLAHVVGRLSPEATREIEEAAEALAADAEAAAGRPALAAALRDHAAMLRADEFTAGPLDWRAR